MRFSIFIPPLVAALLVFPVSAAPVTTPTKTLVASSSLPTLANWKFFESDDELEDAWTWTAKLVPASGAWEARIAFDRADDANYSFARIDGTGSKARARFFRVAGSTVEKQGDPDASFSVASGGALSLQKNNGTLRLLWNGRVVSTATPVGAGRKFAFAAKGANFENPRMQGLETVSLRDDFMRAQGPDEKETPGSWKRVSGSWKTSGLLNPQADATLNPNPFVFRAQSSEAAAFATTGAWFWSDYTVAVSVRPDMKEASAPLVAGVAAYRQSDGTALRGEVDFRKGIARILDGTRVLATSAAFSAAPDQWHKIYLEPGPGVARLVVDGVERARVAVSSNALAQGEAALYATTGANSVDFDDVRIGSNAAASDDFSTPSVGRWSDIGGDWQTRAADKSGAGRRVKVSKTSALTVTGATARAEGTIEARFAQSAGVGAAFAVRDEDNYYLARVRSNSTVLEIVERERKTERVLASAKGATGNDIEVSWRDGEIVATAGEARATATVSAVPEGRAGAWGEAGAAVSLLSFRALGVAPAWGEEKLPEIFTKDRLMQNWANAASLWQAAEGAPATAARWHVGDFFSDSALSLQLPAPVAGKKIEVRLGARAEDPNSGAKLLLTSDATGWNAALNEGTMTPLSARIEGAAAMRIARRPLAGGKVSLRVAAAGKPLLNAVASKAGSGVRLAIATDIADFKWDSAAAQSANVLDYSFTGAPVDWQSAKGQWEVSNRWTCSPQWGFFGGKDSVNPTLWSRFALRGDWTIEGYLATPMDLTRGERSPMDLNVSVGDGRDLASGYSFLFAANGRARNRIMRGDTVVRDVPFVEPKGKGNTHQDWFYIRLERRATPSGGVQFIYTVNGVKVWDYTDPSPLAAIKAPSHLAFWTYNGGLSIARARLWHSGIETRAVAPLLLADANPKSAAPATSFGLLQPRHESPLVSSAIFVASADKTTRIVNPQSGGDWTVFLTKKPFDAADKPVLSWRYKVGPNVLVNLYALVDGKWREIAWTGDSNKLPLRAAEAPAPSSGEPGMGMGADVYAGTRIGAVEDVKSDNAWHDARFDLLVALKKQGLPTKVEGLAFAAPDKDYLRAGLGGNHFGSSYEIANFEARGPKLAAN